MFELNSQNIEIDEPVAGAGGGRATASCSTPIPTR